MNTHGRYNWFEYVSFYLLPGLCDSLSAFLFGGLRDAFYGQHTHKPLLLFLGLSPLLYLLSILDRYNHLYPNGPSKHHRPLFNNNCSGYSYNCSFILSLSSHIPMAFLALAFAYYAYYMPYLCITQDTDTYCNHFFFLRPLFSA